MKQVFCQSCGMSFSGPTDYVTEKDGALSKEYCSFCYQNGAWTASDITFDEMCQAGKAGLNGNTEMGRLTKLFCKLTYRSMLKTLKRWEEGMTK